MCNLCCLVRISPNPSIESKCRFSPTAGALGYVLAVVLDRQCRSEAHIIRGVVFGSMKL